MRLCRRNCNGKFIWYHHNISYFLAETVDMNDVFSKICGMRTFISFEAQLALLKDFYDVTACASLDETIVSG